MTDRIHVDAPGVPIEVFDRPALFLSASEPYPRKFEAGTPPRRIRQNADYVRRARPHRVFDAVTALCKFAFQRDVNLIFGGHPAISPMVLDIASRFDPHPVKRVVVYQSLYFEENIPAATLKLADWDHGTLLWTAVRPQEGKPERRASLLRMREIMVAAPNLIGALFVGGMEGCEEEAKLFARSSGTTVSSPVGATAGGRRSRTMRRMFALGSTGSAAESLLKRHPDEFSGQRADRQLLATQLSYPLVMKAIFADLGVD